MLKIVVGGLRVTADSRRRQECRHFSAATSVDFSRYWQVQMNFEVEFRVVQYSNHVSEHCRFYIYVLDASTNFYDCRLYLLAQDVELVGKYNTLYLLKLKLMPFLPSRIIGTSFFGSIAVRMTNRKPNVTEIRVRPYAPSKRQRIKSKHDVVVEIQGSLKLLLGLVSTFRS